MKLPEMPMIEWVLSQELDYWIDVEQEIRYSKVGDDDCDWIKNDAIKCEVVLWKKIIELKRK